MPENIFDSELFKKAVGAPEGESEEEKQAKAEAEAKQKEAEEAEAARASQEAQNSEATAQAEAARKEAEEKAAADKAKEDAEKEEVKAQSYEEWFAENEAKLKEYLVEKDRDYKSMKPEDLLRLKYERENPDLSKEEVAGLLADDYSLGEAKIEIDRDIMDDDQIKAAEAHNKAIDKSLRKLNADAKKAAKEFDSLKESLERPVYKVPEAKQDPTEKYTVEEFTKMQEKEAEDFQKQQEEQVKIWTDLVNSNVNMVEKFRYSDVEVEVTKEEHDAIKYGVLTFQPPANKALEYADEKGNVLWDKVTNEVAKSILLDKLIAKAKDAGKNEALKNASNYSNSYRPDTTPEDGAPKTNAQITEDIWARMLK